MRRLILVAPLSALFVAGPAVHAANRPSDAVATAVVHHHLRRSAEPVPHETTEVADPALPQGQRARRVAGRDGTRLVTHRVTIDADGALRTGRLTERVAVAPVTEVVAVGTMPPEPPAPPAAPEPAAGVWDRLAACESGGNWSIDTGNGYYGGLQFSASTWRAMGGSGLPHEHSRGEQIRVAERLRDADGGYGAWPACSRRLGLPR